MSAPKRVTRSPAIVSFFKRAAKNWKSMHYYKRNLGDYAKKAGRLTMLQHGSYTLLIDSCYDRETFPTLDQALEWTWASTEAEIEAVKFVLSRFFTLDKDGCYVQDRIIQELLEYHAKADTNKRIAIERETKRKTNNTNRGQVVNESSPNHKPLTINQEPLTKEPKKKATSVACPDFVEQQIWNDWMIVRNDKKAKTLTQTGWKQFLNQVEKAGWTAEQAINHCCLKQWISFDASWLKSDDKKQETFYEREQRAKTERMSEFTPHTAQRVAKQIDPATGFFIDEIEVANVHAITSR